MREQTLKLPTLEDFAKTENRLLKDQVLRIISLQADLLVLIEENAKLKSQIHGQGRHEGL